MGMTSFAILVDKGRLDTEIGGEVQSILDGKVDCALSILKARLAQGTDDLELPPFRYFRRRIEQAVDVLEGRITTGFVNEMAPVIRDPRKAWTHIVNTLVRGGLSLCLCPVRPSPEFPPVIRFELRKAYLVEESSVAASEVFSGRDSKMLIPVSAGIFELEWLVDSDTCRVIASDIGRLIQEWRWQDEDPEVLRAVRHVGAIFDRANAGSGLAVLVGQL